MSIWERLKMVTGLGKAGAFMPGSKMLRTKIGTGHRKSAKERAEERKKKRKKKTLDRNPSHLRLFSPPPDSPEDAE
jgi:hypothetical protein